MLTILTGSPGHGKSYTSVQMIDAFIHEGKFVVTNVPLRADFATAMAKHHTLFSRFRKKAVNKRAYEISHMVHVCTELEDIMRVRFDGKGEGRGKVVLDESQRVMNVRGSTRGKSDEAKKRKMIVNFVSGHRHYGADLLLITQALGNIDLQVRNLMEFHSEVRNFRRLPGIGWIAKLLFPGGNLFLRITWWNDKNKTKAGINLYWLNKGLADLYDTHSLEHVDAPENVLTLPSHPDERPPFELNSESDSEKLHIVADATIAPDAAA